MAEMWPEREIPSICREYPPDLPSENRPRFLQETEKETVIELFYLAAWRHDYGIRPTAAVTVEGNSLYSTHKDIYDTITITIFLGFHLKITTEIELNFHCIFFFLVFYDRTGSCITVNLSCDEL